MRGSSPRMTPGGQLGGKMPPPHVTAPANPSGGGQGALTDTALEICEANQIRTIRGECPFMFFDNTPWPHRLHGFVKKITGAYPS